MESITLEVFNGGINNVIEPHLLQPNFSADLMNCSIHNGAIKSVYDSAVIDATDSELIYQTGNRSIIKWGGHYYWSDNITGELNSTLGYLGIAKPEIKAVVAEGPGGGVLPDRFDSGDSYKYIYNYVTIDGHRSEPFSITNFSEITLTKDQRYISISGFDTFRMSENVVGIEVWRALENSAEFYKTGEAGRYSLTDGVLTFNDITSDADILFNEKYDLTNPDGIPPDGEGKYLCERNSVFYIASGEKVYFSKQSNPHSYSALSYITFDDTVTGMIATESFTMVFTLNRAYIITGDSVVDIAKEEIPDSQGVKNWKTISRVKNMPLWVSNDGLCAYQPFDNKSGRKITVLTENLFNVPDSPLSASVANDVYYLFYSDQTVAFDFLDSLKVYRIDWVFDWGWYDKDNDRLIGKKGEVYYESEGGAKLEFTYTSPDFIAGDMHRLKQMGRMYVDSDCDLDITFYSEGVEVWSHILVRGDFNQRTEFISPLVMGRRIKVKISGTGTLRGLRFDYKLWRM